MPIQKFEDCACARCNSYNPEKERCKVNRFNEKINKDCLPIKCYRPGGPDRKREKQFFFEPMRQPIGFEINKGASE